jgi:hypothetical protein
MILNSGVLKAVRKPIGQLLWLSFYDLSDTVFVGDDEALLLFLH